MPKKPSDSGSSPLETSALIALLLVPIAPMMTLFQVGMDAIAAESIARHALRYTVLWSDGSQIQSVLGGAVDELARSWGRDAKFEFSCGECNKGSLATLRIKVGQAEAIQVAGLEPR